jgi:tetratricopeptide (TPR) repeat protein
MEISLQDSGRHRAALFASSVVAVLLAIQAGKTWLASYWMDTQQLELMERGAALLPGNAEGWDRLGRIRQWDFAHPDPLSAIADYQRSIRDDPRSAHYWMDLASAYEAVGDDARAREAFENARAVYPISAEVAWSYGNFLLREQSYSEAFQEIRRAVLRDPSLVPAAISRVWRASQDVNQLLGYVLPQNADAYFQALDFFHSIHAPEPGLAVWHGLLALGKPLRLSRSYPLLEELIREDRAADAHRVWMEALAAAGLPHDEPASHSLIWDGGFQQDFTNGGLGWRWDPLLGVAMNFDSAPSAESSRSVRLDFAGGANLSLDQPSQYVPVAPNLALHFHAEIRTAGITTESGMRFSIVDPKHLGAVAIFTENLTGSHPWTAADVDFTTGPETHFLVVRLFRSPSRLFENRLSGTVWMANVSLIPSGGEAGQPLP